MLLEAIYGDGVTQSYLDALNSSLIKTGGGESMNEQTKKAHS